MNVADRLRQAAAAEVSVDPGCPLPDPAIQLLKRIGPHVRDGETIAKAISVTSEFLQPIAEDRVVVRALRFNTFTDMDRWDKANDRATVVAHIKSVIRELESK